MSARMPARHRAESSLAKTAAPVVKTAAVVVTSGSLAATITIPAASAAPDRVAVAAPAPAVSTVGAVATPAVVGTFGEMRFAAVATPAPAKPAATPAKPAATPAKVTVTVAKPQAPKPARTALVASRSAVRRAVTPAPKPAPAPAPAPAATAAPAATPAPAPAPAVAPAPTRHSGVIGLAQQYSGIWYVYGGSTPAGFDCSGYTQYIFNQLGISLPRTAEAQRQATTPVSDPQPGDLVFFGFPAFHVGIYAGNGQMYDSPRTGKQSGLHTIWSSNISFGRP